MIQLIEFKTLDITKDIRGQGLEYFIKMIQLLSKDSHKYKIRMNLVYLPLDRKFSLLPDGIRRTCCIVYKKNKLNNKEHYILEVATPDDKTLSTLILEKVSDKNSELLILMIIKNLIQNSGSWNTKELLRFSFKRLKHVKQSIYEWKIRLESNLN
ncbi:Tn7-like element transposition protein TnsE [Staphylococcus hominis]|uniref:Tn7-like element transposition protein TnsE n=1 Tax=Staphylococcus hominis TaxID=1290 RepID=UPI000D1F07B8|nr:Tn7-like element transposition protein TnsE [Staphylococcus hominis]MCE4951026.1 hypothetical protein [Staphylococcus hominis]MCE4952925.1 hypothetical protein [Staphylococcus hominis]MCE4976117.1 hypothetical protein [Staphylococcus hominis]PTK20348.1 hypothetical protein BUZ52_10705 [Staphylococcus hominis]PTK23836.1 hypothetical protein BUZ54_11305 [Staphylococcus hominis]